MSGASQLSPTNNEGLVKIAPAKPMGLNADQLKARLYAKPEVHGHNKPALKMARRRPGREVGFFL